MKPRIDLSTAPSGMEMLAAQWRKPKLATPVVAERHSACKDCGKDLSRRNRTGFCKKCCGRANWQRPGFAERHREALRKAYKDPKRRAEAADRARKVRERVLSDPAIIEARRARWIENRYWERGNSTNPAGSEARKRAGESTTAFRLAWCPPMLRDEYLSLTRKGRMKAADARAAIERQYPEQVARWAALGVAR